LFQDLIVSNDSLKKKMKDLDEVALLILAIQQKYE